MNRMKNFSKKKMVIDKEKKKTLNEVAYQKYQKHQIFTGNSYVHKIVPSSCKLQGHAYK